MKAIKLFLLAGVSLLALSSCQKVEKLGGQEVRFSASANPMTKTEYESSASGKIFWSEGDQILIWSDYAVKRYNAGQKYSVYDIVNPNGNSASLANPASDPNGLTYVEDQEAYNFWAVYPANAVSNPAGAVAEYSISNQSPSAEDADVTETNVTIPADMSQAVLLAQATNAPKMAYHDYTKTISLTFEPAFTAYEITILGDLNDDANSITLNSLELSGMAGDVTATFGNDGITYAASNTSALTYTFPANTTITNSKSVTFTVIALPVDAEGLQLVFNTSVGTRTATLTNKADGSPITFAARNKHRLYGLAMPEGFAFFASLEDMYYDGEHTITLP